MGLGFTIGLEENFLQDFGKKGSNMVLVSTSKEIKLNIVDVKIEKKIKCI